jgi:hypothetical protein
MLSSFASIAVSVWLGLLAVACLRRLWRASVNDGSGYGGRDLRSAGENHHRYRDLGSQGLVAIISQSLMAVSQVLARVIRAALSRANDWISKRFAPSEISHPLVKPISTIALGTSVEPTESQQSSPNNNPAKTELSDQSIGALKKRATRALRQTSGTRLKLAQPRRRKIDVPEGEEVSETASKSGDDRSERRSNRTNKAGVRARKKTGRTKPKISAASNPSLTPKTSV